MVAHYAKQLDELERCVKALPSNLPDADDIDELQPSQDHIDNYRNAWCAVNHPLEIVFGTRVTSNLKLEPLKNHRSDNVLMMKWVDDLTTATKEAIAKPAVQGPRKREIIEVTDQLDDISL
ncbi:hypothetical protein GGX14DRAFT_404261 [Mycena pura]|uniref:Uncharacterized protein n=1 Tax=Mycena pura TaxID=153505 RepID=A0AAD6Y3S4_9AGAR|nr:hypothetical protein GGX14DRAFT_404261 [Mycena pura]